MMFLGNNDCAFGQVYAAVLCLTTLEERLLGPLGKAQAPQLPNPQRDASKGNSESQRHLPVRQAETLRQGAVEQIIWHAKRWDEAAGATPALCLQGFWAVSHLVPISMSEISYNLDRMEAGLQRWIRLGVPRVTSQSHILEPLAAKYALSAAEIQQLEAHVRARVPHLPVNAHCTGGDIGCADGHCYAPAYEEMLWRAGRDTKSILQVGVCFGLSIAMWSDAFPSAHVVGIDVVPERWWHGGQRAMEARGLHAGRIVVIHGNSTKAETAERLLELYGPEAFDLIIDDGGHAASEIVSTFERLFLPLLAPSGAYFIEDTRSIAIEAGGRDRFATVVSALQWQGRDSSGPMLDVYVRATHEPLEAWVDSVTYRRGLLMVTKRAASV